MADCTTRLKLTCVFFFLLLIVNSLAIAVPNMKRYSASDTLLMSDTTQSKFASDVSQINEDEIQRRCLYDPTISCVDGYTGSFLEEKTSSFNPTGSSADSSDHAYQYDAFMPDLKLIRSEALPGEIFPDLSGCIGDVKTTQQVNFYSGPSLFKTFVYKKNELYTLTPPNQHLKCAIVSPDLESRYQCAECNALMDSIQIAYDATCTITLTDGNGIEMSVQQHSHDGLTKLSEPGYPQSIICQNEIRHTNET